jgi:putative ABC transport system permease protein
VRRLRAWWLRLTGLFTADRRAREFDAELASHLEMHIEDNRRRGMTPVEARRQALVALGGPQVLRDAYSERGTLPLIESLAQDLRFATRMLRKAPGFTATAVVVLALGIGANGVIFSFINAVLLKPLNGGRHADLIGLYSADRTRPDTFRLFSYPEFVDLRSRNDVFADLFAESKTRVGVTENGLTRPAIASYVSSNYFRALGATPVIGRFFTGEEEHPESGAAVVVVSHAYWRHLGMPADVIGRRLIVNGQTLTIVGVAPSDVQGTLPGLAGEFWLPLGGASLTATDQRLPRIADDRSSFSLMLLGTLKSGLSAVVAQARLEPLAAALEAAYPQWNRNQRLLVLHQSRVNFGLPPSGDTESMIAATVLMAISGMVLVVACLNLANLQLARGSVRRQEIAVRLALGGSRVRIIRQLVMEGMLLAVTAGAVALGVAWWAAARISSSISSLLERDIAVDTAPDGRMLAVIGAACVLSAIVFSLGPALKLSRSDLVTAMKQAGPLPPLRRRRVSMPGVLVATQVALSLALLVTAGVFARASLNAASSNPGFTLEGGVLVEVDAGMARLSEAETRVAYARILERLRALPDVRAASAASIVPFGPARDGRLVRHHDATVGATFTVVTSQYFETLGIAVVAGREFTPVEEQRITEPVAVIDQQLVARLFSGRTPLGEFVQLARGDGVDGEPLRIVGVVQSVRDDILSAANAHVYVPFGRQFRGAMTFHVRTAPGLEASVMARAREVLRGVDERLPVLAVRTMTAHRDGTPDLFGIMLGATLFAAFGSIGLVLSATGLYGLRAYLVTQRTRELGVRIALGATRSGVVGQLLKEGAITSACGIVVGLAVALALVQLLRMSGMLYEVAAVDPVVFALAPLTLMVATAAASYLPARRALRIDPAAALRPE